MKMKKKFGQTTSINVNRVFYIKLCSDQVENERERKFKFSLMFAV